MPQLLNVLRGDMSLVGPRPVARDELNRSYALFGGAAEYLSVRSGLTGPCQARGRADLAILVRTLRAALRRPETR